MNRIAFPTDYIFKLSADSGIEIIIVGIVSAQFYGFARRSIEPASFNLSQKSSHVFPLIIRSE